MSFSLIHPRGKKGPLLATPLTPPSRIEHPPVDRGLDSVLNTKNNVQPHPKSPKLQSRDGCCETPSPLSLASPATEENENEIISLGGDPTDYRSPIEAVACQCISRDAEQHLGPDGVRGGHTQDTSAIPYRDSLLPAPLYPRSSDIVKSWTYDFRYGSVTVKSRVDYLEISVHQMISRDGHNDLGQPSWRRFGLESGPITVHNVGELLKIYPI